MKKNEYTRDGYIEPEWSIKERDVLAKEWVKSNSKMSIFDYILSHASKRFLDEYNRAHVLIANSGK